MVTRETLKFGSYAAIGALILTLTGIFGSFHDSSVVEGLLTLSNVLLVIFVGGAGYFTASRAYRHGNSPAVNGAVGSLMVGATLAAVTAIFQSDFLASVGIDLRFVFANLTDAFIEVLTFEQELVPGIVILLVFSVVIGALAGWMVQLSSRLRRTLLLSFALLVVFGLLEAQIRGVMSLPDAVALTLTFVAAYLVSLRFLRAGIGMRSGIGFIVGAIIGVGFGLAVSGGALGEGGILRGSGAVPSVLSLPLFGSLQFLVFVVVFGIVGSMGALVTVGSRSIHTSAAYLFVSLLVVGVLNSQGGMTPVAALIVLVLLLVVLWLLSERGEIAHLGYERLSTTEKQTTRRLSGIVLLLLLLIAPTFLGQYITSVLDLMGLYIIMGIGLNIVVGYAGLLDLGYVAFFAIGAYAVGILTTPSLITCGGIDPSEIARADFASVCTGIMTFWEAWPVAILLCGLAGILLGIPVLRLRGDYLAIVTLGFGEIIRLIILSNTFKPLLGGAQGIADIPSPVIDLRFINPDWYLEIGNANTIYYLILFGVIVVALITMRLVNTRLGRAWRAMRADEDVAQAMGINLIRSKLLAFAIGAAFAGMGGAIFAGWLKGIFPNSFTLLVSINVLAMIIIGGLGSLPGVVIGSLMLIGLPEILRELQDYRLLAFGILLVVTMLLKPEGIVPRQVGRLAELAVARRTRENEIVSVNDDTPRKELV